MLMECSRPLTQRPLRDALDRGRLKLSCPSKTASVRGHLRPLETSLRALGTMLTGRWLGLRRSRSPIAEEPRTLQDESFRPNLKYCVPALPVGLAQTLATPLVRVRPAGSGVLL